MKSNLFFSIIAVLLLTPFAVADTYVTENNVTTTGNVTASYLFGYLNWSWIQNYPDFPLATNVWDSLSGNLTANNNSWLSTDNATVNAYMAANVSNNTAHLNNENWTSNQWFQFWTNHTLAVYNLWNNIWSDMHNDSYLQATGFDAGNLTSGSVPTARVTNVTCSGSTVMQNYTSSGAECLQPSITESDPKFTTENASLWLEAKDKHNDSYYPTTNPSNYYNDTNKQVAIQNGSNNFTGNQFFGSASGNFTVNGSGAQLWGGGKFKTYYYPWNATVTVFRMGVS